MPRGERIQDWPLNERLLHYCKTDFTTGCLVWQGTKNRGYGVMYDAQGRRDKAHRVSFEVFVRPLRAGECVLHSCDNPACVAPAHLFAGTKGVNNRDRHAKGRTRNQHTGRLGERDGGAGICKSGKW